MFDCTCLFSLDSKSREAKFTQPSLESMVKREKSDQEEAAPNSPAINCIVYILIACHYKRSKMEKAPFIVTG